MSSCNNLRRERWKRDDDTINWNEPTDEIRVLHSSYASATPDGPLCCVNGSPSLNVNVIMFANVREVFCVLRCMVDLYRRRFLIFIIPFCCVRMCVFS